MTSIGRALLAFMVLACVLTLAYSSTKQDGVPYDPCIVTLCIANTTCIAVPKSEGCQVLNDYTVSCPMEARCIPNGAQLNNYEGSIANYCGPNATCEEGSKCELIYPFCPAGVKPCLPMLGCMPVNKHKYA